jgi:hypothetical protein
MSDRRTKPLAALRRFLVAKFDTTELEILVCDLDRDLADRIDFVGAKEVVAERVVAALDHHNLLDARFFGLLVERRDRLQGEILALEQQLKGTSDPPRPSGPPPAAAWLRTFPGPLRWVLEIASRFPTYRRVLGPLVVIIVVGIASTVFGMDLPTAAVACFIGLTLVGMSELVFTTEFPPLAKIVIAWAMTISFCVSLFLVIRWFACKADPTWCNGASYSYNSSGTVSDKDGKSIAGAELEIKEPGCKAVTSDSGWFKVENCRASRQLNPLTAVLNLKDGCARTITLEEIPKFTCITVKPHCETTSRPCQIVDGGTDSDADAHLDERVDADGPSDVNHDVREVGVDHRDEPPPPPPPPCDGKQKTTEESRLRENRGNIVIRRIRPGTTTFSRAGSTSSTTAPNGLKCTFN